MDEETKEGSLMQKPGIDRKSLRKIKLVQVVNCDTASPSTGCKQTSKTKDPEPLRKKTQLQENS